MLTQRRIYEFDDFRVDTGQFLLIRAGQSTPITPTVFRILLILLERAGQVLDWQTFDAEPSDLTTYDLLVVDGSHSSREALQLCRRLRARLADGFLPILFILDNATPTIVSTAGFQAADW